MLIADLKKLAIGNWQLEMFWLVAESL